MNIWKRLAVILLIGVCCVGCDQTSKYVASEQLPRNTMSSYLKDTVRIGYIENRGAFLGMGKELPENVRFFIFTLLVGLFLGAFFIYLVVTVPQNTYSLIALSCVLWGGASNLYDRAFNNGAVVDFLNVGIGSIRTGVFNIADMAILFGVALFLVTSYNTPDAE